MTDGKTPVRAACIAILTAFCGDLAIAQNAADTAADNDEASVAQACLDHPAIRRTQILNDRNIVFTLRDGSFYNNQLPKQCPSLRRGALVNYVVANRKLCAGGQIQVLWETGAGNYTPAFTCQLGAFVPITETELEDLTTLLRGDREQRRPRRRSAREAVTTEQIELPPRAESESAAAPAE